MKSQTLMLLPDRRAFKSAWRFKGMVESDSLIVQAFLPMWQRNNEPIAQISDLYPNARWVTKFSATIEV